MAVKASHGRANVTKPYFIFVLWNSNKNIQSKQFLDQSIKMWHVFDSVLTLYNAMKLVWRGRTPKTCDEVLLLLLPPQADPHKQFFAPLKLNQTLSLHLVPFCWILIDSIQIQTWWIGSIRSRFSIIGAPWIVWGRSYSIILMIISIIRFRWTTSITI